MATDGIQCIPYANDMCFSFGQSKTVDGKGKTIAPSWLFSVCPSVFTLYTTYPLWCPRRINSIGCINQALLLSDICLGSAKVRPGGERSGILISLVLVLLDWCLAIDLFFSTNSCGRWVSLKAVVCWFVFWDSDNHFFLLAIQFWVSNTLAAPPHLYGFLSTLLTHL